MSGSDENPTAGARALEDLDLAAFSYASRLQHASAAERARLREELTRRCLPFAGRLARRYRARGEPLEDLEQVARLGLVKAIDRYDPDRGSFTAYAVVTVTGEIKRHFRDKTWGVHVPRRLQDLSLEIGHASMVLTNEFSRSPTVAELAAHVRMPEESVRGAMESTAGYSPASLNAPVSRDGPAELGDLIGGADHDLELVDDRLTVSRLLLRLPARERRMLALRFYGNRTQAEIATEFGISQMHVSRLLTRALAWLREAMLSDVPPHWEHSGGGAAHDSVQVRVSVERRVDAVLVRLRGELDRDAVDQVRHKIRQAVSTSRGVPVVVELSAVPLVDAAGIGMLLEVAATARHAGVPLTMTGAQAYVTRILAVAGLRPMLD